VGGESRAFERLVRRYERSVRAAALDVAKDSHLSHDIAQEAFLRAYRQLATLRRPVAFGPWLMRITRCCAVDVVRRRRSEAPLAEELVQTPPSHNGQLDEDKQRLLAAVMGLPSGERQVVMLRYFGEHTVKDVARIAGRSVGTVTKQLSRAHRRLRNTLKEL
jgi:RNA polymerase sigma-70 factor (ECF subfamily)